MPVPPSRVPRWMVCDFAVVISRFFSAGLNILPVTSRAAGPDSLMTAMAPRPGAVESAQMVSFRWNMLMVFYLPVFIAVTKDTGLRNTQRNCSPQVCP